MYSIITNNSCVKLSNNKQIYNTSIKLYKDIGVCEITYLKGVFEVNEEQKRDIVKRGQGSKDNQEKNQQRSRIRSGSIVRELILANELNYHWVLTFADDVTDRDEVLDKFRKFIMRLNYRTGRSVDYVAVLEIQEQRAKKYGVEVWHLHMAINEYIKHKAMLDIWGHGGVRVKKHKDGVTGVAGYLSKYLKKDMAKYEEFNKRRFLCSKGLKRAEVKKSFLDDGALSFLRDKSEFKIEYEGLEWFKIDLDKLNV